MLHHRLSIIATCQLLEQIGIDHYVSLQVPFALASLLETRLGTLCLLLKKLVEFSGVFHYEVERIEQNGAPAEPASDQDSAGSVYDDSDCNDPLPAVHPSIAALVYLTIGQPSSHAYPELSYYLKGQKLWLSSLMGKIVEPGSSLPHESLVALFSTSPSMVALTGRRAAKAAERRGEETIEAGPKRARMTISGFDDLLPCLPPLPLVDTPVPCVAVLAADKKAAALAMLPPSKPSLRWLMACYFYLHSGQKVAEDAKPHSAEKSDATCADLASLFKLKECFQLANHTVHSSMGAKSPECAPPERRSLLENSIRLLPFNSELFQRLQEYHSEPRFLYYYFLNQSCISSIHHRATFRRARYDASASLSNELFHAARRHFGLPPGARWLEELVDPGPAAAAGQTIHLRLKTKRPPGSAIEPKLELVIPSGSSGHELEADSFEALGSRSVAAGEQNMKSRLSSHAHASQRISSMSKMVALKAYNRPSLLAKVHQRSLSKGLGAPASRLPLLKLKVPAVATSSAGEASRSMLPKLKLSLRSGDAALPSDREGLAKKIKLTLHRPAAEPAESAAKTEPAAPQRPAGQSPKSKQKRVTLKLKPKPRLKPAPTLASHESKAEMSHSRHDAAVASGSPARLSVFSDEGEYVAKEDCRSIEPGSSKIRLKLSIGSKGEQGLPQTQLPPAIDTSASEATGEEAKRLGTATSASPATPKIKLSLKRSQ